MCVNQQRRHAWGVLSGRATGFGDGGKVGGGEEFVGVQVFASMGKEERSMMSTGTALPQEARGL
jgi:hypothetical protein